MFTKSTLCAVQPSGIRIPATRRPVVQTALRTAAALAFAAGTSAFAQTASAPLMLRIANYLPDNHYLVEVGLKPWMEQVTKETNGALTFQHFPAQQLGKGADMLRLAQTNVAQMAFTGVSFAGDKMELSDVAQLPNMFEKSCDGTQAYMKSAKSGKMAANDFDKNGVHLIYPMVLPPLQAFTHTKPVNALEDFSGLKILASQRATDLLLSKMGAVPMRLSSGPQAYEGFQRGTVDGTIFAPDSVFSYDMQKMTKYGTANLNFGGQVVVFVINAQAWKSLGKANQDIVDRLSEKAASRVCNYLDDSSKKSIQKLKDLGDKLTDFPAPVLTRFAKMSEEVAVEWATDLDKRGRPGSEVLKAFRANLPGSK